MKNKFMFIIIFIMVTLLTIIVVFDDSKIYLSELTYSALEKKINNNEDFILFVKQDGCSHCQNFTPKFEKVLKTYEIEAYYINITNLTKEEKVSLSEIVTIDGTPIVFFFENGSPISTTIDGNKSKEVIIGKLKATNYIKEK